MNRPCFEYFECETPKPIEFDGFGSGFGRGQIGHRGYDASSIPAKPLAQAKLKRGGFLIPSNWRELEVRLTETSA